jgi:hypothetical protein
MYHVDVDGPAGHRFQPPLRRPETLWVDAIEG